MEQPESEINSAEFFHFAQLSQKHGLEYMVIGGQALNFHKILRQTIDMDIWLKPATQNYQKLAKILIEMDYEKESVSQLSTFDPDTVHSFSISGPIDFLTHVHRNFDFDRCFTRSKIYTIEEIQIPFIGLEDLREIKVLAGRNQDLRDVILIDEFLSQSSSSDPT